ncbi:hypothetical protein UFOVP273_97 [uncultured Caudovirales phage]|uniref:Uncharacterized protein n=1 Tax=uncultured Caudovirales phage TaxID=2100421 RepID=A0A6J5LIN6_9CAUD|nr:hypothetical protein UFOVP273_97 [uncultured Caudovirales phage]
MFNTITTLAIPEAHPRNKLKRVEYTAHDMREFAIANVVADRVTRTDLTKRLIKAMAGISADMKLTDEARAILDEWMAVNPDGA